MVPGQLTEAQAEKYMLPGIDRVKGQECERGRKERVGAGLIAVMNITSGSFQHRYSFSYL